MSDQVPKVESVEREEEPPARGNGVGTSEVEQLQRQLESYQEAESTRHHRGRWWAVFLLVFLGCLLLAGGNVALWARTVLLNTNRWVATVAPLPQNDVVANTASTYVVNSLSEQVDVEQSIQEVLPPELTFLSGQLAVALQGFLQDAVAAVIQSDQFRAVWEALNRTIQPRVVAALRGEGDLLSFQNGQLTVDLSDIEAALTDLLNLDPESLQIPTEVVILTNEQVAAAQQAVSVIDSLGVILPLLALGFLLVGWLISLWRRRTLIWIGLGVAIAMALSMIAFAIARPVVLSDVTDPTAQLLAGEIWDIVIRALFVQTILLLVLGLLITAGATLAGPAPLAVSVRNRWNALWNR